MCQNFPARDPNLKCDGGDVINYTKTLVGEEEKICAQLSLKDNFTMVNSENGVSSIVFESNNIELDNKSGKSKFVTNDLIGLTMDEGKPQLPIYSTLFQINPDKTYEVDYEVLDSYIILILKYIV